MKMRFLFLVFIISATTLSAAAQAKTVTNSDLVKYKQERVAGEKELRENYAKLGFSSPDELARRNAQSAKETAELSAKLRQERLSRERIEAERFANEQYTRSIVLTTQLSQPQYFNQSYWPYFGGQNWYPINRISYQQPGYFAGGQFWPTGSRTPLQPMFAPGRRH